MPRNNAPAQPPASAAVAAQPLRFGAARESGREIEVAVETPVNIVYGNMPYAVMMASPSDLEDFVTGFSLTEGIVRGADEIRTIAVEPKDEGVIVTVTLAPGRFRALYFTRATAPYGDGPLYHHIGLYAYRRRALQRFVGLKPSPLEMRERLEQLRALEAGMRIDAVLVDDNPEAVRVMTVRMPHAEVAAFDE